MSLLVFFLRSEPSNLKSGNFPGEVRMVSVILLEPRHLESVLEGWRLTDRMLEAGVEGRVEPCLSGSKAVLLSGCKALPQLG